MLQISSLREITRLTRANTRSISLRATIPANIVKELELQDSDFVEWDIIDTKEGKVARLKKVK
jgi:hypothetical protein